jgi:hypothetical protein
MATRGTERTQIEEGAEKKPVIPPEVAVALGDFHEVRRLAGLFHDALQFWFSESIPLTPDLPDGASPISDYQNFVKTPVGIVGGYPSPLIEVRAIPR